MEEGRLWAGSLWRQRSFSPFRSYPLSISSISYVSIMPSTSVRYYVKAVSSARKCSRKWVIAAIPGGDVQQPVRSSFLCPLETTVHCFYVRARLWREGLLGGAEWRAGIITKDAKSRQGPSWRLVSSMQNCGGTEAVSNDPTHMMTWHNKSYTRPPAPTRRAHFLNALPSTGKGGLLRHGQPASQRQPFELPQRSLIFIK